MTVCGGGGEEDEAYGTKGQDGRGGRKGAGSSVFDGEKGDSPAAGRVSLGGSGAFDRRLFMTIASNLLALLGPLCLGMRWMRLNRESGSRIFRGCFFMPDGWRRFIFYRLFCLMGFRC